MASEADYLKNILDHLSRSHGFGSLTEANYNNLAGVNHRGIGNPIPNNQDNVGITFFTRPCLNLTYDNMTAVRTMANMATQRDDTIQSAIRLLLSPDGAKLENFTSTLVDPDYPFIALLTNDLVSLSGWPDPTPDTYTSKEGIMKEAVSFIDGVYPIYNTFDLTANFRNVQGDPVTMLFAYWLQYASCVHLGTMVPLPQFIAEREIDYQTRIYHWVLDPTRTYIQKWACTGASFPTAVPLGASFNYEGEKTFIDSTDQISIPFRCMGAEYNDPIAFDEFNWSVSRFSKAMSDLSYNSDFTVNAPTGWMRIPPQDLAHCNYYGYPYVNALTYEMEWWVQEELYKELMASPYNDATDTTNPSTGATQSGYEGTTGYTPAQPGNVGNSDAATANNSASYLNPMGNGDNSYLEGSADETQPS